MKIKNIKNMIIGSAVVLIVAFIFLYINDFNSNSMFFIAGLSTSFLILSIFLIISEKKRILQYENYLNLIDNILNNGLKYPELKNSENDLYIKRLNIFVHRILNDIKRQKKFSGDVAHELKTPLTILRGELELALRNNLSNKEYQEVISSSLDEVLRLIKILQSVLEITKATSGKINLNFGNHDFTELLYGLLDDAKILSAQKSIEIFAEIENDIEFEFDDLRMQQALLNLIENAVKYTNNNGKIWINAYKNDENVIIKIKDNGIGIPKEKQKYIFERFFQIKDNPDTKNGAGIGLSIVKWIIDKHNGDITVNSDINKGAEFIIILPMTQ